jgi:hypothetical protein
MLYFAFALSLFVLCCLKLTLACYDHFSTRPLPRKKGLVPPPTEIPSERIPTIILLKLFNIRKPNWVSYIDPRNKSLKRKHAIVSSLSSFLSIFTLAAFFFAILQFWFDTTNDIDYTTSSVFRIEQSLHVIKKFVQKFKFITRYDWLLIAAIIFITGLFPIVEKFKLKPRYKSLTKTYARIVTILAVVTSFTFFGNNFLKHEEGIEGKLAKHRAEILENNKLLVKNLREEVENEVAKSILRNENITRIFQKANETKYKTEQETNSPAYSAAFSALRVLHPEAKTKIDEFKTRYDKANSFDNDFTTSEERFEKEFHAQNPNTTEDFYDHQAEKVYNTFKEENKNWYSEQDASPGTNAQHAEAFENFKSQESKGTIFEKYEEPIKKSFKKVYKATLKSWINGFFQSMGVEFPFMDEILDPVIHTPLEEYITDKTYEEARSLWGNHVAEAKKAHARIQSEVDDLMKTEFQNNLKFKNLSARQKNSLSELETVLKETPSEYAAIQEKYFKLKKTSFDQYWNDRISTGLNQEYTQKLKKEIDNKLYREPDIDAKIADLENYRGKLANSDRAYSVEKRSKTLIDFDLNVFGKTTSTVLYICCCGRANCPLVLECL